MNETCVKLSNVVFSPSDVLKWQKMPTTGYKVIGRRSHCAGMCASLHLIPRLGYSRSPPVYSKALILIHTSQLVLGGGGEPENETFHPFIKRRLDFLANLVAPEVISGIFTYTHTYIHTYIHTHS